MTIELYVVDTSALVEVQRKYPQDVFNQIWRNLSGLVTKKRIVAPVQVSDELKRYAGEDHLKTWIDVNNVIFKETNMELISKSKEILSIAPLLIDPNKEHDEADPYVIALAILEKSNPTLDEIVETVVVTEESFTNPNKIPSVCHTFRVQCVNILQLFRREGWKF